jgi:hypothetical protein
LARALGRTTLHSSVAPSIGNWLSTGAGASGLTYVYVLTQHACRVELHIDRGDAGRNAAVFEHFANHRSAIEASFGEELDWQPLPDKRSCRINFDVAEIGYRDADEWPLAHDALIDAMVQLEEALAPHVISLKVSAG